MQKCLFIAAVNEYKIVARRFVYKQTLLTVDSGLDCALTEHCRHHRRLQLKLYYNFIFHNKISITHLFIQNYSKNKCNLICRKKKHIQNVNDLYLRVTMTTGNKSHHKTKGFCRWGLFSASVSSFPHMCVRFNTWFDFTVTQVKFLHRNSTGK